MRGRQTASAAIGFAALFLMILHPHSAEAKPLSRLEAVLIAAGGGFIVGTIWHDSRQAPWNRWWETASYTAGFLGGSVLLIWEDPPDLAPLKRPGRLSQADRLPVLFAAAPLPGGLAASVTARF